MTHQPPAARLEFLTNAARILCTKSPTTSAHLLAVHNDLLFGQCKALSSSQEREFCPACGSLRVPGWTLSVTTAPKQSRSKRSQSSKLHAERKTSTSSSAGVVYKCLRCHRHVIQSFPKSRGNIHKEPRRPGPSSPMSQPPSSATVTAAEQVIATDARSEKRASDNASSRKRAKARKNQGLLATLAAEKQQSQPKKPSSSLDLLDFLQQ